MNEIWADIPGYKNKYIVSEKGIVKSIESGKELKGTLNEKGYIRISLSKNNVSRTFRRCRIVATLFIPNPNNLPEVNHKDGNKQNDCKDNLEWSTRQSNMDHAYQTLGVQTAHFGEKNHRSKSVVNLEYGIFYESITEAAKSFGIQPLTLQSQLVGTNPHRFPLRLSDEIVTNPSNN